MIGKTVAKVRKSKIYRFCKQQVLCMEPAVCKININGIELFQICFGSVRYFAHIYD